MDNDQMKYKPIKVCGICGDKALGYNFNAITCEACKAFFRRNALRTKDFKCPFDGNCKIDLVTRRFCQKCRLKKCFDIGMKKEWILSEEEKKVKRDKIMENRRKKESLCSGSNGVGGNNEVMLHSQHSNTSENNSSLSTVINRPAIDYSNRTQEFMLTTNESSYQSALIFKENNNNSIHNEHNKEFINSLYLLEHHKYPNIYLSSKLFPDKEPSSTFSKSLPNESSLLYSSTFSNLSNHNNKHTIYHYSSFESATQEKSLSSSSSSLKPDLRSPPSFVKLNDSLSSAWTNSTTSPQNHLESYPIVQRHSFKKEPIQEEFRLSSIIDKSRNDFDLIQKQHQFNCKKIIDQSLHISSDESESATIYSSYNSDKNTEDLSTLDPPDLLSNHSLHLKNIKHEEEQNGYSSSDKNNFKHILAPLICSERENLGGKFRDDKNQTRIFNVIQQDIGFSETMSKSYNYVENIRMEELAYACDHLQNWLHHGKILYELKHLTEIYQVAERVIQHLIAMAKMINSFSELCENDQISLLKCSVTEIMILRSVPCFLPNRDAWIFNLERNEKGTLLQFSTCKTQIPSTEFSDDIKHFLLAIPENCKTDRNLLDLVTMVVLFNPNRLDLKHKEIVKLEYLTYRHLLRKYININYSAEKTSRIHFTTILELIDRLQKINDKIKNVLPFRIIEQYKTKFINKI